MKKQTEAERALVNLRKALHREKIMVHNAGIRYDDNTMSYKVAGIETAIEIVSERLASLRRRTPTPPETRGKESK